LLTSFYNNSNTDKQNTETKTLKNAALLTAVPAVSELRVEYEAAC